MSFEKLSTSRELASILGIAQITVQRLAARGELPARKVAGKWRFSLSEVEAHLSRKVETGEMKDVAFSLETIRSIQAKLEQVRKDLRRLHRGEQ